MSTFQGKSRFTIMLLCTAALAAPLWTAPALAQGAEADETDANDIIVTAQRRNEKLEDVPMTVQVVSQETLTNAGINTVRELANVTTGFQVGNSGSFPQPAIRGITTINAGSYENNVALFIDGLYQFTPQVLNMDLPNVQNIQILKGPQSTLFGRNATGGAIQYITNKPTKDFESYFTFTGGRFKQVDLEGAVGAGQRTPDLLGPGTVGFDHGGEGVDDLVVQPLVGAPQRTDVVERHGSFPSGSERATLRLR